MCVPEVTEEELNKADAELLELNPSLSACTREERVRFMIGIGTNKLNKVEKSLSEYLEFRENDLKRHKEHLQSLNPDGSIFSEEFLRIIQITEEKSILDSTRIAYILPGAIDTSGENIPLYRDGMTVAIYHSLTVACYMDSILARDSLERLTIILDARYGEGENFSNPGVYSLTPIMKEIVKMLQSKFNERLRRFIMFPLPSSAMYAWKVLKYFIDQKTLSRYVLIGANKNNSQIFSDPPEQLKDIMSEEAMKRLEKRRRDMFIES